MVGDTAMNEYRVRLSLDVIAESPLAAAQLAVCLDRKTDAIVEVFDFDGGCTSVDMTDHATSFSKPYQNNKLPDNAQEFPDDNEA